MYLGYEVEREADMVEYYVVLGDVVHSREIEDREAFQDRLEATCQQFTARERDDVWGDFKILKGIDEFGGVLQSLENVYEVVTAFQKALRPHEVRMVVAGGSIDVGLTSWDVEKMDGEAFHRADERLEEIEDGPLSFDLLVDDDSLAQAVADEINLLLHVKRDWTDRQWEVASVRERVGTQTAVAEKLGVTQQAVSNVLSGANWPLVNEVEGRLRETLAKYEPPLDRESGDSISWFEQVVVSVEREQYDHALAQMTAALGTAANRGGGQNLVEVVVERLTDVVEPMLTNTSDAERVKSVVSFLIELAERTTGTESDDLEAWSLTQYARVTDNAHDRLDDSGSPERLASDSYCTALGFLLASEPATAVQPLKRAWDLRDDQDESTVEYATSAGVALLGCADLLGQSVLDAEWDDLHEELTECWEDSLRAPARKFLEDAEEGVEVTPEEIAEAIHEADDREQFAEVEARAFATLLSMLQEQAEREV